MELRQPTAAADEQALASARAALHENPAYPHVAAAMGSEHSERAMPLLLLLDDLLAPAQRTALRSPLGTAEPSALADELSNLRAQLAAIASLQLE